MAVKPEDTNENRAGLIGTLVSSDKPIVVNSGSANGSFGNGGARDYGIDQIVELSKVGKEYIFVKEIPKSPTGKILRRKLLLGEYEIDL